MSEKQDATVRASLDEALAIAREWATPENMAALDAITDADMAERVKEDADAAPELTDDWFARARLVIPLGKRAA